MCNRGIAIYRTSADLHAERRAFAGAPADVQRFSGSARMLCDLPSLVIRLGLTGHRPKRIGISNDLLAARVGSVLECLTQASDALLRSEQDRYDADAPMIRRFTCGLAPGADVVGAQAALEAGWTLQTILAFPRERFEELAAAELSLAERDYFHATFSPLLDKSASVLELDGPEHGGVNRNAYELVGDLTLEQSDVVLALWDGLPAQGLGGTAHLVRLARERGLPLVWIDTSVDVAPRVFLPGSDAIAGLDELSDWVRSSLGLSSSMPDASGGRDAQTRWNDYRNEKTERFGWFPPLFHWLLFFGGRKWPRWPLRWRDCEKTWN
ncbi:MAG TPA: hypothetical protein VJ696_11045, partial [Rhodanobacteraceae bacterium]|nr:hypothetical protein [Rhodanobacteraceae bacterium]